MPKYKIRGKGKDSGRSRTRTYKAKNEISARAKAEADDTTVDEVEKLPPAPPTEGQIAYAKGLGIKIPDGVTKDEISDLISCKVDEDSTASPQLIRLADDYSIETTRYTGERSLYDRIFSALSVAGREQELAAWFAFNVLKDRAGARCTSIAFPDDARLSSVASNLVADTKAMQSIKRYSESTLLWFGEKN
ncbi:MAG: hypothetical protein U5L98_16000 [Halomonas sp.]|uniref:hypothetical protein n=1 Tax=Halomonas sp. TaxID=1486246 RepID=UPI002ACEF6D2|nr:hypothetical protein [Halomonas sp.]MDZ7854093.1 hypothetical protein [Halomonas sp.]